MAQHHDRERAVATSCGGASVHLTRRLCWPASLRRRRPALSLWFHLANVAHQCSPRPESGDPASHQAMGHRSSASPEPGRFLAHHSPEEYVNTEAVREFTPLLAKDVSTDQLADARVAMADADVRKVRGSDCVQQGGEAELHCPCFVPDTQASSGFGGFWRFRSRLNR